MSKQRLLLLGYSVTSCLILALWGYAIWFMQSSSVSGLLIIVGLSLLAFLQGWQFFKMLQSVQELKVERSRMKRVTEEVHLNHEKLDYDARHAKNLVRQIQRELDLKNKVLAPLAETSLSVLTEQQKQLNDSEPDLDIIRQNNLTMMSFSDDLHTLSQLQFSSVREEWKWIVLEQIQESIQKADSVPNFPLELETEDTDVRLQVQYDYFSLLLAKWLLVVRSLGDGKERTVSLITYIDGDIEDAVRLSIAITPKDKTLNLMHLFSTDLQQERLEVVGLAPAIVALLVGYFGGRATVEQHKGGYDFVLILPQRQLPKGMDEEND